MRTNIKLLILLLSLAAATTVSAHPTMSDCNMNFVVRAVSPTSDVHARYVPETSQITEPFNTQLAAIGAEILEPPPDFTDFSSVGAKTLPPVPAALFMVLTGFLCFSFVRDRRVWLAALAGLLWAGQAGFQVIPQLASNISKHIQKKTTANIDLLHRIEDLCRLRSDIEGTKYIGLLRHLAGIPTGTMSLPLPASLLSLQASFPSLRAQRAFSPERSRSRSNLNLIASFKRIVSARAKSNVGASQFAIAHFSSLLNPAVICPAAQAEQNICFSPAFIFQQLPRGPPNFT